MINNLYIKDFAIIDEIDLPIKDGLTVITGETGAGKSIILQALNVTLGGKTTKTMVRSTSEKAVIETKINDNYYRRILNKSGRTKSFINEEPLTEDDFRDACTSLVDFHGQHEQQFIMHESSHIDYLDAYCSITQEVNECVKIYNSIKQKERELVELINRKQISEQQIELMNFQLNEIQSINPLEEEDIELENELSKLKHLDEIVETVQRVTQDLTDDDAAVYSRISVSLKDIERLEIIDEKLTEYTDLIRAASVNIQEASVGLIDYINSLDHDKSRLIEIQDRLGAIDNLKRKYGGSIESILDKELSLSDEIKSYNSIDSNLESLNLTISNEKKVYNEIVLKIHELRSVGANKLAQEIANEMRQLNMPDARFEINISQKRIDHSMTKFEDEYVYASEKGIDIIQFLLSANPGERLKPLVEIASGGEISRIMLAIKTVFQMNDPIDTLVFDEIDSGISGTAAEKVAQSLSNLAKSKQVICITHLPQIARLATNHLHVTKYIENGRTEVKAEYLNDGDKLKVLNQLTSSN